MTASSRAVLLPRRGLLAAGAAAFAARSDLTPARAAPGDKPVRFGIFGNAQKLEARRRAVARFAELHPETPVSFEGVPSDAWPDKIASMVAGGTAPDVFALSNADISQYAARRALATLDEFVPATFHADKFDKSVLDLDRLGGKLFGVPIAVSINALAYNQSALKRVGLPLPPSAWTYDEFARHCADIHKADAKLYGSHDAGGHLEMCQMYMLSQGRQLCDGQKLAVGADDMSAWLAYWDGMRRTGGAVPPDLQAVFTDSQWPSSPLVKGSAVYAPIASQDLSGGYQALTRDTLGITVPPSVQPGGSPGYFPQPTSNLCLYARSANKEAAVRVIDWFVSDPESAKVLGLVSGPPASRPALETVLQMADIAPVDQAVLAYTQANLPKALPGPATPLGLRALTDLLRRVNESVAFGKAGVKDAAAQFVTQGNATLRRA